MTNTRDLTPADIEQLTPDDVDDRTHVQLAQLDAAQRRIQELLGERHLTEAVARRVADQASIQSQRNRVLLDALALCVVLFDEQMACQFLNRAAADYLGVSDSDSFIGHPVLAIHRAPLLASGLVDKLRNAIDLRKPLAWQYIDPSPQPRTWRACLIPLNREVGVMLTLDQVALTTRDSQPKANAATVALALLSPREREILDLVAAGHSSQAIATGLHRSLKTVQLHRYHIAAKLGTSNVARWVLLLLDAGVLRRST